MAATITTLFSQSNVEALMIIEPKTPRFEIKLAGAVKQTIPATRAWKAEQKIAVEAAQVLLAEQPAAKITSLLTSAGLSLQAEGEQPTRKAAALTIVAQGDAVRIVVQGGPNAQARADLRRSARSAIEAVAGWTVDAVQDGLVATPGADFTPLAHDEPAAVAA